MVAGVYERAQNPWIALRPAHHVPHPGGRLRLFECVVFESKLARYAPVVARATYFLIRGRLQNNRKRGLAIVGGGDPRLRGDTGRHSDDNAADARAAAGGGVRPGPPLPSTSCAWPRARRPQPGGGAGEDDGGRDAADRVRLGRREQEVYGMGSPTAAAAAGAGTRQYPRRWGKKDPLPVNARTKGRLSSMECVFPPRARRRSDHALPVGVHSKSIEWL